MVETISLREQHVGGDARILRASAPELSHCGLSLGYSIACSLAHGPLEEHSEFQPVHMEVATFPGSATIFAWAAKAVSYGMSAEHSTMLTAVLQGEVLDKCYSKDTLAQARRECQQHQLEVHTWQA